MRISDWSSDVCSSDLRHNIDVGIQYIAAWTSSKPRSTSGRGASKGPSAIPLSATSCSMSPGARPSDASSVADSGDGTGGGTGVATASDTPRATAATSLPGDDATAACARSDEHTPEAQSLKRKSD